LAEGICPACGAKMKKKENDVYVCPKCRGVFLPESIFGVR